LEKYCLRLLGYNFDEFDICYDAAYKVVIGKKSKELILCYKLKFGSPYFLAT